MAFLKGIKQVKIHYNFSNLSKDEISEWRATTSTKNNIDLKSSNISHISQKSPIEMLRHQNPLRDESTLETPMNPKLKLAMGFSDRIDILRSRADPPTRERSQAIRPTMGTTKFNSFGKKSEKSSVSVRNMSKGNTRIFSGTTSKLFKSMKTSYIQNILPQEVTNEKEDEFQLEYFKIKDIINKRIRNESYECVNYAKEYRNIRQITNDFWSGIEVLKLGQSKDKIKALFEALNKIKKNIWMTGFKGIATSCKNKLLQLMKSNFFNIIIVFLIIGYTVCLSLEGIISDSNFDILFLSFNAIYVFEFILKLIAFGVKEPFSDYLNQIDAFCVLYIAIYYIEKYQASSIQSNFKSFRFFRALLLFRVQRIFRYIQYMKIIVFVLKKTLYTFISIALILFLIMYIYSTLGIYICKGKINLTTLAGQERNFESFWEAFMTVFNIITMDKWYQTYLQCYDSSYKGWLLNILYFSSLVIIGSIIFLNLFIALMLDGFEKISHSDIKTKHLEDKKDEAKDDDRKNSLLEGLKLIFNRSSTLASVRNSSQNSSSSQSSDSCYTSNEDSEAKSSDSSEGSKLEEQKEPSDMRKSSALSLTFSSRYSEKKGTALSGRHGALGTILLNNQERKLEKLKNSSEIEKRFKEFTDGTNSLFFLSSNNKFRKLCYRVLYDTSFQKFIMSMIVIYGTILILETMNINDTFKNINFWFTLVLNIIFTVEIIMKIVLNGLVFNKKAVVKNTISFAELLILTSFYLGLSFDDEYGLIKKVAYIRVIRPLRLIYKIPKLGVLVNSLLASIQSIASVLFVVVVMWWIFALVGMAMFRNRFGYCENPMNFGTSKLECGKRELEWINHPINFDNIFNSFLTLLIVSTFDGWGSLLNIAVNSNLPEQGPIRFNNQFSSYIYFMSFIFIGIFLFLNLFIGVLFSNFIQIQKKAQHPFLNENQVRWFEMQKIILYSAPLSIIPPRKGFKHKIHLLLKSKLFKSLLNFFFLFNLFTLMLYRRPVKAFINISVILSSSALSLLYFFEIVAKIVCYGFRSYFKHTDFVVEYIITVCFTFELLINLLMAPKEDGNGDYSVVNIIIRTLAILRLMPLIRMLHSIQQLGKLFRNLYFSFGLFLNIFLLFLLVLFVYSILGCLLFKNLVYVISYDDPGLDDYTNFKNFFYSSMLFIKISTGDNWVKIMMETKKFACEGGETCESK